MASRPPLLFLLTCLCAGWPALLAPAHAATYVVDVAAPGAADTNPGSEDQPFRTVQHAAALVAPGDTVCVMAGTYAERVTLKTSGTKDQPITFRAGPRRSARIQGFATGPAAYVRLEGFDITAPKGRTPGVEIGGDDVEVVDNYLHDLGLALGPGGGKTPAYVTVAYNDVYQCQEGIWAGGSHWRIENNHVHRATWLGVWGDADYTRVFGTDHLVRYNLFDGSQTAEIGKAHLDCVQVFDSNGEIAQRIEVCYNVEHDFHQTFMGECKKTKDNVSDWTFHHNIASCPNAAQGFVDGAWGLCSVGIPRLQALNNTYYHIKWYGIGITDKKAEGGLIRNNLFAQIDQALKTKEANPTQDHNLLFQAGAKDVTDQNLRNVDPQMVDPEKGNYRLRPGSPAIAAGADGATIGALEYPNVYYVDPRHPGATDEGFGYAGQPYHSLAHALAVAQSGETVILRGGVYREVLKPAADGVTVRAFPGETVTISGADLIAGWTRAADGRWSAPLPAAPTQVLRDGQPWTGFTYDPAAQRLVLNPGGEPRAHLFETVVRSQGLDLAGRKEVKIEGITAVNLRPAANH